MGARDAIRQWIARIAWAAGIVFVTIVIGGALDARRRLPDLEPWHRIVPRDARAADLTPQSRLPRDRRPRVQASPRRDRATARSRLASPGEPVQPRGLVISGPARTDWNRTQELSPQAQAIGGAFLIHGLTDA